MRRSRVPKMQFLKLYNKRWNDTKIGEELGFHRTTIGAFRRKLCLPARFGRLTEKEKKRIRTLHGMDWFIKRISEEIDRAYLTVLKFCRAEGLDTSRARAVGTEKHKQRVLAYLKENGPTPKSLLKKAIGIDQTTINKYIRGLFDQVEKFKFTASSTGASKYGSAEIYDGLSVGHMGSIIAIRNDPRIIDFVASHIPFKVETGRDAQTLVMHLKKQLGYDRARQVVEKLGYEYKRKSHRDMSRVGKKGEHLRKFTDEQFLELYNQKMDDKQIAEKLNISHSASYKRRKKLGLSSHGKRGRRKTRDALLNGLFDIYELEKNV